MPPQNIHVVPVAPPRSASSEGRGAAATRLVGRPRRKPRRYDDGEAAAAGSMDAALRKVQMSSEHAQSEFASGRYETAADAFDMAREMLEEAPEPRPAPRADTKPARCNLLRPPRGAGALLNAPRRDFGDVWGRPEPNDASAGRRE